MTSYAVRATEFRMDPGGAEPVIVRHGTDDRRPPRDGVPSTVRAMCGEVCGRVQSADFEPESQADLLWTYNDYATCVECARRAIKYDRVIFALVCAGVPISPWVGRGDA